VGGECEFGSGNGVAFSVYGLIVLRSHVSGRFWMGQLELELGTCIGGGGEYTDAANGCRVSLGGCAGTAVSFDWITGMTDSSRWSMGIVSVFPHPPPPLSTLSLRVCFSASADVYSHAMLAIKISHFTRRDHCKRQEPYLRPLAINGQRIRASRPASPLRYQAFELVLLAVVARHAVGRDIASDLALSAGLAGS